MAGQGEVALELIRTAIRHAPGYVAAHNNLGNVLRDLGDLEARARPISGPLRSRQITPRHSAIWGWSKRAKRGRAAEASYRKALN